MRGDKSLIPEFLYHYFETGIGPFRNLSDLPPDEAERIPDRIRAEGSVFASRRGHDYLSFRRQLEAQTRTSRADNARYGRKAKTGILAQPLRRGCRILATVP